MSHAGDHDHDNVKGDDVGVDVVDRALVFLVVHRATHALLLAGRLVKP